MADVGLVRWIEEDDSSASPLDRCTELIVVFDDQFRITVFNSIAQRFYETSAEQARGKRVFEVLSPLDDSLVARFESALRGEMCYGEIERLRGSRKERLFSVICAPLKDKFGTIVGALVMCQESVSVNG